MPARLTRIMNRCVLILLCALTVGIRPTVAAADLGTRVAFDIPPQQLPSALLKFATQSGVQVTSPGQLIEGKHSAGVVGTLDGREALRRILKDTALRFDVVDDDTVMIVPTSPAEKSEQTQAQPAESADPLRERLEEIVVTAQKKEERLLETPQSVTALSATALESLGATQFRDFANTVPGLSFSTAGAGYTQITLRGVTSGVDTSPTVGVYVDDVPYGSSTPFAYGGRLALDVGLFDVDRVEVLRGPQGTLYGASTMGGLVKYVSRTPDTEAFSVDARTGVSSINHGGTSFFGSAAFNVPLGSDRAALRASVFESHDGGYVVDAASGRENVNRADIYGGRFSLLLKPNDRLSLNLTAFLQNISRDGQATADYGSTGGRPFGELGQYRPLAEYFDHEFRLVSGTATYDFGAVELTSISSYQTSRMRSMFDLSAKFVPLFQLPGFGYDYSAVGDPLDQSTDKFTQEARLASSGSARLEWLIGGFYTHEKSKDVESFYLLDAAGQPAPNIWFGYTVPTVYAETAAFGDLTYHLTEALDVTAGLRRAHNEQSFEQLSGNGAFDASIPRLSSSESVTTYLANARYRFGPDAMLYGRFATGYRAGGPNFVVLDASGNPLAPAQFDADKLKSYEVGFKAQTSAQTFSVDLGLYHIDWSDLQVLTNRGGFGVRVNAPGAAIKGAELTLNASPLRSLVLTGAFAYQHAQMSEDAPELSAVKGDRLPDVPRFTAALNADYLFHEGGLRPGIGFTLRHVSDRVASYDNAVDVPQYDLPSYTSFDVRGALTLGQFNAQLYVRNVFDERGQLSAFTGYSTFGGPVQISILQPRTVGVNLSTRF